MKTLIYSTLAVAAIAASGQSLAQDPSRAPAYGPAVGTPEYYNNSGGHIDYDPAAAREQLRREGRHEEIRRLDNHERALIQGGQQERSEQARRLELQRQIAEDERIEREFRTASRRQAERREAQRREAERERLREADRVREADRARLADLRERERFARDRERSGIRQRDRDGDGVSNRRDRYPDDPHRS